jgi:hypothetical protein
MDDVFDHLPILIACTFMLAATAGMLPKTRRGHALLMVFGVILLSTYVARRVGLLDVHLPIGRDFGLLLDFLALSAFIAAFVVAGRRRSPAA